MDKEFEALDKLEECANGMKDLPKSNWIDLAENEAELDLKIMDWVETIKFELFKGKQALTELKAIKEAKPSEALKCVDILKEDGCITTLYQGKALATIRGYILNAQELEKENAEYKEALRIIFEKKVDIVYLKDSNNVEEYNKHFGCVICKLTEEEFNILMRWSEKCQKNT